MDTEAQPIPLSDLQVGDVFLKGGNPGHVVMVVDLCENADGKKPSCLHRDICRHNNFMY